MQITLSSLHSAHYVDCSISDCFPDGYWKAGCASLRTVENVPVSDLPQADCEQFGHETAGGWCRVSLRTAKRLFGVGRLEVGMVADITPNGVRRNRAMRKMGTFRFYI